MNYFKYSEWKEFKAGLIEAKEDFICSETNYTAKLDWNFTKSMYNDNGKQNTPLLTLINKIRKHNEGKVLADIDGIDYFKLFHLPKHYVDCYKIDLSSAYWTAGMQEGIITEEMEDKVQQVRFYDNNDRRIWDELEIEKRRKDLRLRAMGALATTKTTSVYEEGQEIIPLREIKTQDTKNLYLSVHKKVDDIMKDISERYNVHYYYFDCFFSKDKALIKAIEDYGFRCKVERARIKLDTFLEEKWVHDLITGNKYNIREEHYLNIK